MGGAEAAGVQVVLNGYEEDDDDQEQGAECGGQQRDEEEPEEESLAVRSQSMDSECTLVHTSVALALVCTGGPQGTSNSHIQQHCKPILEQRTAATAAAMQPAAGLQLSQGFLNRQFLR